MRMKTLITILLRATGLHTMLVSYHRWRLRIACGLMKRFGSDTHMPVWCSARATRHQRALQRLCFLLEREFALAHRVISDREIYRAFCDSMRARFPDDYWSCSCAANGKRVTVIAPPAQMSEWQRFLCEYDQVA
jgi:hypothetical protein